MNEYEIVLEYNYVYDDIIKKVISDTLKREKITNAYFEIIFVDEKKIQYLNNTYRNKNNVTDVISFAFEDNKKIVSEIRVLGEIYICIPQMIEQAKIYEHSEIRELSFLIVHGLLHLLGYDHEKKEDEKVMFEKQELILNENSKTKRRESK